ncbi:MAG: TonB-dependent receptor plug domain-containing protein [Bacteroidales bacterium]
MYSKTGGKAGVVWFRRWANRSYAVFNSLHREVRIGVLCASYSLLLLPSEVCALTEPDSTALKLQLHEITVSGQRTPLPFSQTGRIISVVPRSEIVSSPAQNLQDILEYLPNVDVRQRGANGVQADLSIRGGTTDQTLVLLNGVNFNDPQTGHYSLNLPLEPDAVERVELIEGGASRVFGPNAFSGAVNFITSAADTFSLRSLLSGGDFGYFKGSLSANLPAGNTRHLISIGKTRSGGYMPATDFETVNLFYHANARLGPVRLEWQGGMADKAYGAANFYGVRYTNQFEHTKTWFASLKGTVGKKLSFSPLFYWKRNSDHYILERSNPAMYQNFHRTDVAGINLSQSMSWVLGHSSWGADFRIEHLASSALGHPVRYPQRVKGHPGVFYHKGDSRRNWSLYAEHNFTSGPLSVSAGIMTNHLSELGNWSTFPGLDFQIRLFGGLRYYGSVGASLRLPTFTDLYYQGRENVGNPHLKPEKSLSWESGFKWLTPGIQGHMAYFERRGRNLIDWIWYESDQKWHTENLTRVNTRGATLALWIDPRQWMGSRFFVQHFSASYSYTTLSKAESAAVSYYLLDNLKHKADFSLSHRIVQRVSANWRLSWQDRNGSFLQYNPETQSASPRSYRPFGLLDARVVWKKGAIELFAEATNLLNTRYYDLGNITQPSRWGKTGIVLTL